MVGSLIAAQPTPLSIINLYFWVMASQLIYRLVPSSFARFLVPRIIKCLVKASLDTAAVKFPVSLRSQCLDSISIDLVDKGASNDA